MAMSHCSLDLSTGAPRPTVFQRVYFHVAAFLDVPTLCAADTACRHLLAANAADRGPWASTGLRAFAGVELRHYGTFDAARDEERDGCGDGLGLRPPVAWKRRYVGFYYGLRAFEAPFSLSRIVGVGQDNENAYMQCLLRTDLLAAEPSKGVYLEFEVLANPDNFSVSVADFDGGGCGSFTFSPDTGVVICEQKVAESPRKIKGSYKQPLCASSAEQHFHGSVGLFLQGSSLAFFRRRRAAPEGAAEGCEGQEEDGPWETTGFVSDLSWVQGRRLTPCIAFRCAGLYEVSVARLSSSPPICPEVPDEVESEWLPLDWEEEGEETEGFALAAA